MIKVGLIGFGYWGKILYQKLKDICEVVFVCDSAASFTSRLDEVDWIVIATPDDTHYDITKACLVAGKNVFCEKPLSLTYSKSKTLFELASANQLKLYVDDVERYKDHEINFLKHNLVKREKVGNGVISNLLYILTYHDVYLLFDYIKELKVREIVSYDIKDKLHFEVVYDNAQIEFLYAVGCEEKTHHINNCNLVNHRDALKEMLTCVLNNTADFSYNKQSTLFVNQFIDSIKNNLYSKEKNV
jgi:hypothetical protein